MNVRYTSDPAADGYKTLDEILAAHGYRTVSTGGGALANAVSRAYKNVHGQPPVLGMIDAPHGQRYRSRGRVYRREDWPLIVCVVAINPHLVERAA